MSIEGPGIWEAAKARGIAHVPCVVVDHLDPNDLRLLRVALNRLGETGAWNVEALRLEFEELTVLGSDLLDTGFEMAEIDTTARGFSLRLALRSRQKHKLGDFGVL